MILLIIFKHNEIKKLIKWVEEIYVQREIKFMGKKCKMIGDIIKKNNDAL